MSGSVSLGWSLKEGLVEGVGVTQGAGFSSVLDAWGWNCLLYDHGLRFCYTGQGECIHVFSDLEDALIHR